MSPLFAPVLAQLVTLGLGDRTEARLEFLEGERTTAGSNSPSALLSVQGRRVNFAVGYQPTFTLRPLDSTPRELEIAHEGMADFGYAYPYRHTTFRFTERATVSQRNYRTDALAPVLPVAGPPDTEPDPDPGTEPDPGAGDPEAPEADTTAPQRAVDTMVRYGTLTTTLGMNHEASARTTYEASVSHHASMGLDRESRREFPLAFGESGFAGVSHQLTRRDRLSLQLNVAHATGAGDSFAWNAEGRGQWDHTLTRRTSTYLGAGVNTSYTLSQEGLGQISIFPTADAGIQHATTLARGVLGLSFSASTRPRLDFLRATVDPQLGASTAAAWARDRTTLSLAASTGISLRDDEDSFNSATGNFTVFYTLDAGFMAEAGARAAWQTLGDRTLVPPVWALFIALSWSGEITLHRNR